MLNRRRFLHDSLRAAGGISLLRATATAAEAASQEDPISFDLHAHPGGFFDKGTPAYLGHVAFTKRVEDMRDAKMTGAFFSLVGDAPRLKMTDKGVEVGGAYGPGDGQREYHRQRGILRDLFNAAPVLLATRASDLERARRERKVAAFLSCEGGGEFLDGRAELVDQMHAGGVRSFQVVHYVPSAMGDLQTQPRQHGGLSSLGKAVVKRAAASGMVIDVAHAAFDTVRDVASATSAPIILSHSILKIDDSRPLAARAISEDHAKLVAQTGGVIGAWPSGFNTSFEEFVANTKRLIDLVGIDHVGLGTDMDGNFKPVLSSYAQVGDWAAGLQALGLTPGEVAKVRGGNMQRVFAQVVG